MSGLDDASRIIGQLEASLNSLNKNLETLVKQVKSIDDRLAYIERAEQERKGAWRVLIFVAGIFGAVVTKLAAVAGAWLR